MLDWRRGDTLARGMLIVRVQTGFRSWASEEKERIDMLDMLRRLGVLTLAMGMVVPASAGPDVIEGGDAGGFISSATTLFGNSTVDINSIQGSLGGGPRGPGDFEDMYAFNIDDPAGFSATVVTDGATTDFDARLWLFDTQGRGLLGNDEANGLAPGSAELLSASDDGTGVVLTTPGRYFLAISGSADMAGPNNPRSESGLELFDLMSPMEISGPDGPGGADPLTQWTGPGQTGNYLISLTGVTFIEAPVGACCDDDICFLVSSEECTTVGGIYSGDGTTCAGGGTYGSRLDEVFVPDNDPTGLSDTITITETELIDSLQVRLDISALRVGDVVATLSRSDGIAVTFISQPGLAGVPPIGDDSNLEGLYTFSDNASTRLIDVVEPEGTDFIAPPGFYQPTGINDAVVALTAPFAGTAAEGDWTLTVFDLESGEQTEVREWALIINGGRSGTCSPECVCEYDGDATSLDVLDLLAFLRDWFMLSGTTVPAGSGIDLNGDGTVDVLDLLLFLTCWFGATNGPDTHCP